MSWNMSRNLFLFFTLIFFLLMGCVLDAVPVMLIFFPSCLPVAIGLGIDPVHYGVVTVLNLMIGLLTPPVGALLFIQTKIAKISINVLVRELVPHIAVLVHRARAGDVCAPVDTLAAQPGILTRRPACSSRCLIARNASSRT